MIAFALTIEDIDTGYRWLRLMEAEGRMLRSFYERLTLRNAEIRLMSERYFDETEYEMIM